MALNPYSKVAWQNAPSQATPVNATNLNKMDDQIYDITDHLINLNSGQLSYSNTTSELNGQTPQAAIDELAKPAFTEAGSRANIASGEKLATILGKIKKYFSDLKTVAFSGSYTDLSNKPTIPTNTSQLVNDSNFLVDQGSVSATWTSGDTYRSLLTKLRSAATWNKISVNSKIYLNGDVYTVTQVYDVYGISDKGYVFTSSYTYTANSMRLNSISMSPTGNIYYYEFRMSNGSSSGSDESTSSILNNTPILYY